MSITDTAVGADGMPLERLEAEIASLAGHLDAATCRWLGLVADFDRREGWASWGLVSCAAWLSWKCGLSPVAAREKVRVARALEELPAIRSSFARGELSYSKVRALTRVATPASDAELAVLARHTTTSQLERLVRAYRQVTSNEDEENEAARTAYESRSLSWYHDDDGCLVIKGRLPADMAATFLAAMAAVDAMEPAKPVPGETGRRDPEPSPDFRPSADQRRADALVAMAESALASGPDPCPERNQVVLHVDDDVLGGKGSTGHCEIQDGPALAPEVARRMACDATLRVAGQGPGHSAHDLGRRTRVVSAALRRALWQRDQGCRFPGCENRLFVDAHHVQHWAKGGSTDLSNLVLACRRHHVLVHEGGFGLAYDATSDTVSVTCPDGRPMPTVVDPPALEGDLPTQHQNLGLRIGPDTCESLWGGERMDLGLAIDAWLCLDGRMGLAADRSVRYRAEPDGTAEPVPGESSGGDRQDSRGSGSPE